MANETKKLKVAFFSEDFSRKGKGTALVVQKLAEQYINNFTSQIELILIRKKGFLDHPVAKIIRNIEIKIYPLPVFATLCSYLIFFITCRENFDAVIFNKFVYPGFWLLNSKKFILIAHDAPVSPTVYKEKLMFSSKLMYWFLRFVGKHYLDALIVDSKDAKREVVKYHRVDSSKIFAVYIAVGDEFRKFSDKEKIETKLILEKKYGVTQPYLLDVSRLDPHKNIETLIDAFSILKNKYQIPHRLVIVGGRHLPVYSRMIEEKIKNLSLDQDVVISPYIEEEDLPGVYNLADTLVFPSLIEGFGLPLAEAMRCGIPVVASDIPVMREITADAALLVDPLNSQFLAEKILELLKNVNLRQELIKRGLARAQFFSWQKTAGEIFKIIKN